MPEDQFSECFPNPRNPQKGRLGVLRTKWGSLHFPEWGTFEPYLGKSLSLLRPLRHSRNGEEGRCRAGPEEGEEVGREEVMGVS